MSNDTSGDDQSGQGLPKVGERLSEQVTLKEMQNMLNARVEMMKQNDDGGLSDQYRVYLYIVEELKKGTKFLPNPTIGDRNMCQKLKTKKQKGKTSLKQ